MILPFTKKHKDWVGDDEEAFLLDQVQSCLEKAELALNNYRDSFKALLDFYKGEK